MRDHLKYLNTNAEQRNDYYSLVLTAKDKQRKHTTADNIIKLGFKVGGTREKDLIRFPGEYKVNYFPTYIVG